MHQSQGTTSPADHRLPAESRSGDFTRDEKVRDFLAQQRIAVTGISAKRELTGNIIYRTESYIFNSSKCTMLARTAKTLANIS